MRPKVALIIVNWNGFADTSNCLKSLAKIDYPNYDIVVVDNGSSDGSADRLQKEFSAIDLVRNEVNLGFAEGSNIGMRYARKNDPDYFLLLNNDTSVDHHFLTELIDECESDSSIGMAGPKIYLMDHPNILSFAGGKVSWLLANTYHVGKGKEDNGQFNDIKDQDYINGCCLLVRRNAMEKLGGMDPGYFLYWEETDWCYRARRAGYKLVCVPKALIWHKVASSSGGASAITEYYDARNRLHFFSGYSSNLIVKGYIYMAVFIRSVLRILKLVVSGSSGNKSAFGRIKGMAYGTYDHFKGRRGECLYKGLT